jgi:hypothetical protein
LADPFPGVAGFLSSLDHGQRERFLLACEARESPLQVWLYACALGYEADFTELENWLQQRYPQLNRRKILEAEAVRLERDITALRGGVGGHGDGDDERAGLGLVDMAKAVASLTKELRAHLVEIERMSKGLDRRGLILSGVDRLMRTLQDMFSEDEEMQAALREGFDVVWSQLNEER